MTTTDATAELVDVSLHYSVHGDQGPWVTLVHGGMMGSAGWLDQARRLADRTRVLTFDLRGYGRSSKPRDGYTVTQFAADMLALWDALAIAESAVVGFSMGGFVAIETALRAPERVSALMLVGTADGLPAAAREGFLRRARELELTGTEAERAAHVDRVFSAGFRAAHPAFIRDYANAVADNDPRCLAATFRGLAAFDRRDAVSHIACPVLVVCGERDAAIPPEHSRALAERIAGSRLVTIAGAGHTVHAEQPETFAALVREVLTA
ncbi:MAG: alpha/beta fold hydrolase [Nitriliruptorales bacterium]|nr:alpha/beta fold hydrolase [Nitriliruptorales bacterium]